MLTAAVKISVNKSSSVPIRDQLIEQLGLQIASGILKEKDKLPSIRALAQKLGVHHSTITSVYNHLAEAGLLEVRQGSGVRVAERGSSKPINQTSRVDLLFTDFLAKASEQGYAFQDIEQCFKNFLKRKPVTRILVVDRNSDFHSLIIAELQPHFSLPVQTITHEELSNNLTLLSDSLLLASLYHVFPLLEFPLDPTRFVACNVEPGKAEMEIVKSLPINSIVLLVSVSPTLLKMATNVAAALRGEEIAIRTVLANDTKELRYMRQYAKAIICDSACEATVRELSAPLPVNVFHLYSTSTIALIKDRLGKWG